MAKEINNATVPEVRDRYSSTSTASGSSGVSVSATNIHHGQPTEGSIGPTIQPKTSEYNAHGHYVVQADTINYLTLIPSLEQALHNNGSLRQAINSMPIHLPPDDKIAIYAYMLEQRKGNVEQLQLEMEDVQREMTEQHVQADPARTRHIIDRIRLSAIEESLAATRQDAARTQHDVGLMLPIIQAFRGQVPPHRWTHTYTRSHTLTAVVLAKG